MIEIETEIAMRGRVVKESCTRAQYGSTLSNGTVAMPKASQPFVDCPSPYLAGTPRCRRLPGRVTVTGPSSNPA
jgi:hypothetical protein